MGEAAILLGEWCTELFATMIDAARNIMASCSISADEAPLKMLKRQKYLEEKYKKIRNVPEGKSNNWLKMHGYPMRREVAGRHGRRKEHICRNHSGSCPEDNGLSKNKYQEPGRTPEIESEVHNCKGKDLPAQGAGADRSGNMPEVNRQPQLAVCNSGLRNQNIRRNQNGRRYSGGWPSRKR
jgi:hypothetical protein